MPATAPMVTAEAAESFIKSLLFIIISPFKCRRLICAEQSRPKLYSKRPAAGPTDISTVSRRRNLCKAYHKSDGL